VSKDDSVKRGKKQSAEDTVEAAEVCKDERREAFSLKTLRQTMRGLLG
jgi:hypothetical protein